MNFTPDVVDRVLFSTAAVESEYPPLQDKVAWSSELEESSDVLVNLREFLDSSELSLSSWRIDGSAAVGTQFFTIPTFIDDLIPMRIDTFIPPASEYSPRLREALQSLNAIYLRDNRVAELAVSKLVVRVLDKWLRNISDYSEWYQSVPFGTRIVFENIDLNIDKIQVKPALAHELERELMSVESLQEMWKFDAGVWPESLDLTDLRLKQQLHDSVCLVQLSHHARQEYVFKSSTSHPQYLYHELKLLLTMDSHPNIIPKPLYIVTKLCKFGGKKGVVGFILEYFPMGTLRDYIPPRHADGTLQLSQRLIWAEQITETLIHIRNSAAGFYSDLRLDNLVLTPSIHGVNVVMIDFEQRGNWFMWAAPEVNFFDYLQHLMMQAPSKATKDKYRAMIELFTGEKIQRSKLYDNRTDGYCTSWTYLSKSEQESAQVYLLGRLLWCIFEGEYCPSPSIWVAYKSEQRIEFPQFVATPGPLRNLIARCTIGAPEWDGRHFGIVRIGDKLYARGEHIYNRENRGELVENADENALVAETQARATEWWSEELRTAVDFFERRKGRIDDQAEYKQFFDRPSLEMVCEELKNLIAGGI